MWEYFSGIIITPLMILTVPTGIGKNGRNDRMGYNLANDIHTVLTGTGQSGQNDNKVANPLCRNDRMGYNLANDMQTDLTGTGQSGQNTTKSPILWYGPITYVGQTYVSDRSHR